MPALAHDSRATAEREGKSLKAVAHDEKLVLGVARREIDTPEIASGLRSFAR
ncbi:hypothetical protein [Amycolatopsis sp.]|uniref:hypothetical protein n=1 Tax=Amycolatopsis sp. TaxID=37632 RepID=UPI002CBE7D50|nr:hypothetical protein [Amycolatopsis sp.]HVV13868.1 hypothetical protein [Amycolatopsis sp.]